MQIQVIKDKLPELVKEQGKIVNYAECKNNEFYLELLINQVGTACNQFFNKPTVENILEIQLVLEAILETNGISTETYQEIRNAMLEQMGTYTNKYIGFFQESAAQADTETNA
jgi:predicted house-cleaning noncanonical NTP pyrophosphatase (MazG superfamily)